MMPFVEDCLQWLTAGRPDADPLVWPDDDETPLADIDDDGDAEIIEASDESLTLDHFVIQHRLHRAGTNAARIADRTDWTGDVFLWASEDAVVDLEDWR